MPVNNALTPEGSNALGAAFGYYPQLRRNRQFNDPVASSEMPLQFMRGRLATTMGTPSDILNMFRSPNPMEVYGDVNYAPQQQVPYGSQELMQTLPLAPTSPAGQLVGNVGSFVPMTPAEALQVARVARQAALAGGKVAKKGARLVGEELNAAMMGERQGTMLGAVTPQPMFATEPSKKGLFNIFDESTKYHQKVPEIKNINVANLKRMNSGEVADVSDEVAANMDFSKPIQVSVFSDGEMRIVDGHHRVAAAKKLGISSLPVELQAINARGNTLNKLAQESVYPQQSALNLAQERASLPVEQGGLGLPKDNTPQMRAQAMGFDTPVYRGYQFGTGRNKNTFYTDNPLIASQYAEKGGSANYEIKSGGDRYLFDTFEEAKNAQVNDVGGRITKLKNEPTVQASLLNMENPLVVDAKEKNWNWITDPFKPVENQQALEKQLASVTKDKVINGRPYTVEEQKQDILRDNYFQVFTDTNRLVEEARKKGYSNAVIQNVYDTALPIGSDKSNYLSNVYVSMNPENERSRFAAFDPFRRNAAIATTMGVAAPDLLASQQDSYSQNEMRKFMRQGR